MPRRAPRERPYGREPTSPSAPRCATRCRRPSPDVVRRDDPGLPLRISPLDRPGQGFGLEHHPEGDQIRQPLRRDVDHPKPLIRVRYDEVLLGETDQHLANDRTADIESLHQRFEAQRLAVADLSREDICAQRGAHILSQSERFRTSCHTLHHREELPTFLLIAAFLQNVGSMIFSCSAHVGRYAEESCRG